MKTNPNSPAMPTMEHGHDNVGLPLVRTEPGLTIRQEFAKAAMEGLCANSQTGIDKPENIARWAVEQADLLINELNKQG